MAGSSMLVTLTVEQLREMVRQALREELKNHSSEVKEVLLLDEAAKLLELHPKVLVKKAKAGEVPAHKLGTGWRFLRSELLAHLASQKAVA